MIDDTVDDRVYDIKNGKDNYRQSPAIHKA